MRQSRASPQSDDRQLLDKDMGRLLGRGFGLASGPRHHWSLLQLDEPGTQLLTVGYSIEGGWNVRSEGLAVASLLWYLNDADRGESADRLNDHLSLSISRIRNALPFSKRRAAAMCSLRPTRGVSSGCSCWAICAKSDVGPDLIFAGQLPEPTPPD